MHEAIENEKGVEQMCREMEEIRHEGVEEGRLAEKKDTAKSLSNAGMPVEKITQILKVDVQAVREWLLKD
ncbi:hypothetical protein [Eubacterium ramulus]|jgi:predicted transposase/invertase (TIGR01784 family)|uniref:hypothetical protein n=1 Tax=Eubacterium ramulus TaxID=39490 RepID=UPI0022E74217|nr:hypothetical protein [Eubacterium ramulus]